MSSTILVTGALGNVGAAVVKELQESGKNIRAADMDRQTLKEQLRDSVECVRFDFTDAKTYASAFDGVEKMFLMRPPRITNIERDMYPALDAAKRAGVKYIVFLSLIGIENAKFIPHYKVETYLKKQNFQTTYLRCSFFMQNLNTTHAKEIKEHREISVPVGNAKTSFIDVRDIGAVAARCLLEDGHAGRNYDLTGAQALDYWQVAKILSETLQREIKYRNPNPIQFLFDSVRRGTPLKFALVMTALYTSTRFGMAEPVTDEVQRITGRKPIPFQQYAREYREAWL